MKKLLLLSLLIASTVNANEATCLSKIMYAEARGESFESVISIGQSAVTRAENQDTNVCQITGVNRKQPSKSMYEYYMTIARQLLNKPSTSVSLGADSWERGTKPHIKGNITRQLDNQVFYVMQVKGEK